MASAYLLTAWHSGWLWKAAATAAAAAALASLLLLLRCTACAAAAGLCFLRCHQHSHKLRTPSPASHSANKKPQGVAEALGLQRLHQDADPQPAEADQAGAGRDGRAAPGSGEPGGGSKAPAVTVPPSARSTAMLPPSSLLVPVLYLSAASPRPAYSLHAVLTHLMSTANRSLKSIESAEQDAACA